jgi:hypothetical protein
MRRVVLFALLGLVTIPVQPVAGQGVAGEWNIEHQIRERWIHGRQLPRFSPFRSHHSWLFVDSLRRDATGRRIHVTLSRFPSGRDTAVIVTDGAGRVARVHVGLAPFSRLGGPSSPGDSARWVERRRFRSYDGAIALAESRVWDLIPTSPPGAPRIGLRWTDTITRAATDGPYFRQALRGARTSLIAGDTVVNGRRLWIVHDSARVQYEERYLEHERTLDTAAQVSRAASGVIRGVHLYDAELGLFRRRDDTTSLSGEAVLHYPDGRAFRTPARYESTRRWDLYDRPQYAARIERLRDESRRQSGGMVVVPTDELQRRLAEGDVQARDSLVGAWVATEDPDEGARLFGLLGLWVRDAGIRAGLDSLRLSAGDTTHLYRLLTSRAYSRVPPFDTSDVRAMLRFMEDPGLRWGFNLERDHLYENLAQALTSWPYAAAVMAGSEYSACTVAACRMIAEQWLRAREPRTRDVGLVALFSLDPARWADTVLALDGPRRPLLRRAAALAKGIGATWNAASKAVMPPPNSDWRVWLEWMDGRDREYLAAWAERRAQQPERMRSDTVARVRFEETHWTAIRMYMARTGRDITDELQRGYAGAESDSARLVFGTMLQRLGRVRLTEGEIAEAFASGVPPRIALARTALVSLFGTSHGPVAPAAAATFIDRVIAAVMDGEPLWRAVETGARPQAGVGRPMLHAPARRIVLNGDSLPEAIRAKWSTRVEIVAPAEWRRGDAREAGAFYTFAPIRAWGRFVRVQVTVSERLARPEGQAPAQYASGNTYYLMQVNGEWVVVAADGWIT